jgi:hypothetical protein
MNIDGQILFLVGSILVSIGALALGCTILVLNNLFSKFWKPVKMTILSEPIRFMEPVKTEPVKTEPVNKSTEPKL